MPRQTIYRTRDLHRAGHSRRAIERALSAGELIRARPGWYVTPHADADVLTALRRYSALTCVSALSRHGVWVPRNGFAHLRPSGNAVIRPAFGVRYCRPYRDGASVRWPLDEVPMALLAAMRCQPLDNVVAMLDSALHQGKLDPGHARELVERQPLRAQRTLARWDGQAQSGTESLVRVRLQMLGVTVVPQARIPGVGWVDLLVGDCLVIECDSRAHHTGEQTYRQDRERDRELLCQGYLVLRLTYEMVLFRWDEVVRDILWLLRQGRHRARRGRASVPPLRPWGPGAA